ncbi:OsmC family protein [Phenylobacterium kunshanense]|uniref:OsmC family peroxiredoxin n=1 Tax=Phenylobacterium kunshanense TaxID=1445034 RepID=A0A328BI60_9CAUL|nr:OsmC family protein [Phenylobacterium kunshanense]RAK67172.1 OsmC family peroxiredoxin [Phenylobacterium kunshanense]
MTAPASDPDVVNVSETGAGRFQVRVAVAGSSFLADEPVEAGGLGSGPNPYDLLASALGACTVMTLRLYAERKGWPLDRAEVRVLHARTGLEGRDRFAREIVLHGDLDGVQRARLMEIADRCPVHRSLERGAEIISVLAHPPMIDGPAAGGGDGHLADMQEACCD